jgi:nicotinate-nucleotide adenylyltransferase
MRLGLLGGTFDPPHLGHLILAEVARDQLGLERVLFLPAGQPPHKPGRPISPLSHRLAMTKLAIADNPHFELNTADAHRPPPHYTYTLLPLLHEQYPQAECWLIIGGDSLRDFAAWREPGQVIAQCRLAVLPRPGASIDWDMLEPAVPGLQAAVDMLSGPSVAISGTEIRSRIADGRSARYLTLPAVLDYIEQQGLYRPREDLSSSEGT